MLRALDSAVNTLATAASIGNTRMKDRKQVHHRDSESGQFTTERHAQRSPATTEREVIRHPVSPPVKTPPKAPSTR